MARGCDGIRKSPRSRRAGERGGRVHGSTPVFLVPAQMSGIGPGAGLGDYLVTAGTLLAFLLAILAVMSWLGGRTAFAHRLSLRAFGVGYAAVAVLVGGGLVLGTSWTSNPVVPAILALAGLLFVGLSAAEE